MRGCSLLSVQSTSQCTAAAGRCAWAQVAGAREPQGGSGAHLRPSNSRRSWAVRLLPCRSRKTPVRGEGGEVLFGGRLPAAVEAA